MEFRCRLASPNGEIVEGVYVADTRSPAAPRARGEGPLRPLAAAEGRHRRRLAAAAAAPERQHARVPGLQPGTGDAAEGRHAARPVARPAEAAASTSPVFRRVLDDVHERVRSGSALSDAFAAHGDLFPRVYTASLLAGERSGNLDAVLRRYVEYTKIIATVKRKTVSALVYPAILIVAGAGPRLDHRAEGRAGVRGLLRDVRRRAAARRRGSSCACRSSCARSSCWSSSALVLAVVGVVSWVRQPGQKARFDRLILQRADARARWRGSSRRRRWRGRWRRCSAAACRSSTRSTSRRKSVGNQYMAGQLDIVSARVREGRVVRGGARSAAASFRKSPSRWRKWASRPARFRTC